MTYEDYCGLNATELASLPLQERPASRGRRSMPCSMVIASRVAGCWLRSIWRWSLLIDAKARGECDRGCYGTRQTRPPAQPGNRWHHRDEEVLARYRLSLAEEKGGPQEDAAAASGGVAGDFLPADQAN